MDVRGEFDQVDNDVTALAYKFGKAEAEVIKTLNKIEFLA